MSVGAIDSLAHVAELLAILLVALVSHVKHLTTRKQVTAQVETLGREVEAAVVQTVQSLRPPPIGCELCEHAQSVHDASGCSNRFCGCPGWRAVNPIKFNDATPPRGTSLRPRQPQGGVR